MARPSRGTPTPEWVVRSPDPSERAAVLDLAAKTFGRPYWGFHEFCDTAYFNRAFDWNASRIGLYDGALATLWGVWDHRVRIGRARWRVAGVGCVACRPDLRNRGLLSRTARPSLDACRAAGYDATMLFGIPDFYHRFGYVRAASVHAFHLSAAALAAVAPPAAGAPARVDPARRAEIDALYNKAHDRVAGSIVRPFLPDRFPGDKYARDAAQRRDGFYAWPPPAPGRAGGRRAARWAGYAAVEWDGGEMRLTVSETAGDADAALSAVSALARDWHAREIVFDTLPPRGPAANRLRRADARETVQHRANAGSMVKVLSWRAAVAALAGELSDRLARSGRAGWRGAVRLAGDGEPLTLDIGPRGVRVADGRPTTPHRVAAGAHLAQLLFGTCTPDELADAGRVRFAGDGRALAEAMFPALSPSTSRLDYY